MNDVGVVAIGRNEGERLSACLEALRVLKLPVVYVDSGSTDGSIATARRLGVEVVELDECQPFSAARARNSGAERVKQLMPKLKYIQFIDGDCVLNAAWLSFGRHMLESQPTVAVVCGRRRERFAETSIYNRVCDLEWNGPVGEVEWCGGDFLIRADAFSAVGGFDPTVPAGEEPEMCQRLRKRGFKILRLDSEMTLHDAAMTHFLQWWNRQVRTGYGSLDVAMRFGLKEFKRLNRSVWVWIIAWPLATVIAAAVVGVLHPVAGNLVVLMFLVLVPLQILKIARGVAQQTGLRTALSYGVLNMLSKLGQGIGHLKYLRDRATGRNAALIEYKNS